MTDRLQAFSFSFLHVLTGVLGICILGSLFIYLPSQLPPAEDACILFRYSKHLAEEGSIRFNPGGPAIEGATDFLWMLLLALGMFMGINPHLLSGILSFLGVGLCVLLFSRIIKSNKDPSYLLPLLVLSLVFNSQLMGAVQGFSVAFWGGLMALCWYFFWQENMKALVLGVLALTLTRPDGMVIGVPLLIGLWILQPQHRLSHFRTILFWGLLPGMIYFFWRYWYFGEFLPLPMYVKGSSGLVLESLLYEGKYVAKYLFPLLAVILYSLLVDSVNRKKRMILLLSGLIFPLLFYATVHLEQNIADRFMYPVHLGALWIFFISWNQFLKPKKRALFGFAWSLYFLLSFLYFLVFLKGTLDTKNNNPIQIAKELAYIPEGTMAITEAGYLPYYSEWQSLDLWGLNSPDLARRLVEKKDLEMFNPDLIVLDFDYDYAMLDSLPYLPISHEKSWTNMVLISYQYAMEAGSYDRWMLPLWQKSIEHDSHSGFQGQISNLIALKKQYLGGVFIEPYPRYHLYLLNRNAKNHASIQQILRHHGAISWDTFQQDILP